MAPGRAGRRRRDRPAPRRDPGLRGLEHRHPAGRERRDRRGDDGLADARPGAGDDEDHRLRPPRHTAAPRRGPRRTARARASSASVSVGARGQPEPARALRHRRRPETARPARRDPAHAAAAATATSGSPSTTGTTADGGAGTPAAAARAAAGAGPRPAAPGSARSTRRAASAAPTQAGARPVSKMNERAVSTRCADHRRGPETAPPWLPSAFDSVTVATTSSAPASPTSASSPRPPGPTTPEPVRLVHHQQRAAGPADRVQLAQRGECRRRRIHAVDDDQRALLVPGGEHRVDGGGVVARHDGDPGTGEPAGVDERGVVGRVGDDERARAGERGDAHRGWRRSRRRTPAPAANPQERGELAAPARRAAPWCR